MAYTSTNAYTTKSNAKVASLPAAQPSWAHAELTLAPWKKMLSIAANALNFHVVGSLINMAETWDAVEFFYKAGQLISRKKIGTTSWVEEKSSGKNSDPNVPMERYLLWENA